MNFKQFVGSLRIRVKLLVAFGSILVMSVMLIVLSVNSIDKIIYFKSVNEKIDVLKLQLEKMELTSHEFIYEGYKSTSFLNGKGDESIEKFDQSRTVFNETFQPIREEVDKRNDHEMNALIQPISISIDSIHAEFESIKHFLKKRGFKDAGMEGTLREAIHHVENAEYAFDKAAMLTLRRHEKDFFLRKDLKYQKEFNDRMEAFMEELHSKSAPDEVLGNLQNYQNEFNSIVTLEQRIGLKYNEGIRGAINKNFLIARPLLEQFGQHIKQQNESQITVTKTILVIVFVLQLLIGLALATFYSNLLTKAIKEIRMAMQQLAQGIFPREMEVHTQEEIGQTKIAFNQFLKRLTTATHFAGQLGEGNLKAHYPDELRDDVLAKSIISMQKKLMDADERQYKINWINKGSAEFNDILKTDNKDLRLLSDRILKHMITYVHGNQGALFLKTKYEGVEVLERIATYAYEKKKFLDDRYNINEGLIGQCVAEKTTLYLKEIPRDYVRITSGLGDATPRNVLIVPLKNQEEVLGVLELASFKWFEPYQIEFIERMAESIGTILLNKKTEIETQRLLQEAVNRSDALARQEEVLRQNAEELQTTQEEMERQRMEMQREIEKLKSMLAMQSDNIVNAEFRHA